MQGRVKFWKQDAGYGFLKGEDGKEIFCHFSAIQGAKSLAESQKVEFDITQGDRGLRAQNVVIID